MVGLAQLSGSEIGDVESGVEELDQRELLLKYAVELLQMGSSRAEVVQSLALHVEFMQWVPQEVEALCQILFSAEAVLRKGKAKHSVAKLTAEPVKEPAAKAVIQSDKLQVVALSEVQPTTTRWLWPGRIPLGKVTAIYGTATGKTCLSLDLAARVSSGAAWPDEEPVEESGPGPGPGPGPAEKNP